jgi:hypothetical protein
MTAGYGLDWRHADHCELQDHTNVGNVAMAGLLKLPFLAASVISNKGCMW